MIEHVCDRCGKRAAAVHNFNELAAVPLQRGAPPGDAVGISVICWRDEADGGKSPGHVCRSCLIECLRAWLDAGALV